MKHATAVIALLLAAACSSSKSSDNEPSTVPPAQPISSSTPSVEAQIANLQTSMTELLDRLDVLNERLSKLEAASGGPPPTAVQRPQPAPPQVQAPPTGRSPQPAAAAVPPKPAVLQDADVAESYRQALILIGQGKQAEARAAFQKLFDEDRSGHLADNALFWIGETYYQSGDYPNAMRYYQRVINEFPEENKAPDAMFKLALAYVKTGDLGMAKKTLEDCIGKYPYSSPAASAKLELKRISY